MESLRNSDSKQVPGGPPPDHRPLRGHADYVVFRHTVSTFRAFV